MITKPTGLSARDVVNRSLYLAEHVFTGSLARQKIYEVIFQSEHLPPEERAHVMVDSWHLAYRLGFHDLRGAISMMSKRFEPC
jgi:hypothetical protein